MKESLFTILHFDVPGRRVLDLFAGTGQLGIEALSRGASQCVFVDNSAQAVSLVKTNLERCGMQGQVVRADVLAYLEGCGKFDLVLIDPPYRSGLYNSVLEAVFRFDILNNGGIIAVESLREEEMPSAPEPYEKGKTYHYGKISLTIYRR